MVWNWVYGHCERSLFGVCGWAKCLRMGLEKRWSDGFDMMCFVYVNYSSGNVSISSFAPFSCRGVMLCG